MAENTKLGNLLARLRGERGLTQEALAEACGVSRTQIARIETGVQGKGDLSFRAASGFAKAFGITAEKFMAMVDAEQPADMDEPRRPGRPKKAEAPTAETPAAAPKKPVKPAKGKRKGIT